MTIYQYTLAYDRYSFGDGMAIHAVGCTLWVHKRSEAMNGVRLSITRDYYLYCCQIFFSIHHLAFSSVT